MRCIYLSNGINHYMGGPRGYVANLSDGCAESHLDLSIVQSMASPDEPPVINDAARKSFPSLRRIAHFFTYGMSIRRRSKDALDRYDLVHVHDSIEVLYLRWLLGYRGQIVLTPHRPEPLSSEMIGRFDSYATSRQYRACRAFYKWIEIRSYKEADAFLFPSPGAEGIYRGFPGYAKHSLGKPVEYVMTGVRKKPVCQESREYRYSLGLYDDDFLVAYLGRHNRVKGYDLLAGLAGSIADAGVKVVCAGAIGDADIPDVSSWTEVGYISNPQDLINSADVVVVPNRETYFDLIIIEVLAAGKMVITSDTGGNVDIASQTDGVLLFKAGDESDLLKRIIEVREMSQDELRRRELENIRFYESHCSLTQFARGYQAAMDRLEKKLTNGKAQ